MSRVGSTFGAHLNTVRMVVRHFFEEIALEFAAIQRPQPKRIKVWGRRVFVVPLLEHGSHLSCFSSSRLLHFTTHVVQLLMQAPLLNAWIDHPVPIHVVVQHALEKLGIVVGNTWVLAVFSPVRTPK